jgi:alcohol dehydrogenase (cytochrome c)
MTFLLVAALAPVYAQPTAAKGQALFNQHCAVCHGTAGEGNSAPGLSNGNWQAAVTDAALHRVIREGLKGTAMPGFGDRISGEDAQSVILHIRTLTSDPAPDMRYPAPQVQVTPRMLLQAGADEANWLMYGRDYTNQRFSPHKQIDVSNVARLAPAWTFQTGVPDGLQATPLYVNGVLYLSTSWNHVFAIDAKTGREIWHYRRRLPAKLKYCCGPVNRGVAILGSTVYLATLDAHLVAIDAQNGRVRWDVEIAKVEDNFSATSPPLIAGGKVVVGTAGGDYASRGFIAAYDANTGRQAWRFYTIPGKGEPGVESWSGESYKVGGAATWMNGSYDPDLNLVYWGAGNPFPDYDGDVREGDNLYSDSVVALDLDTGKLRWHYQFTPHDVWDYDGVNEMVLVDLNWQGRTVKSLVHADRNGHFFAIDRTNGKFLYAKPFVRVTWTSGYDANGRPTVNPAMIPTYEGVTVCPGAAGGKEWNAMSYSPLTRLVYVPAIENCANFYNYGAKAKEKGLPPGPNGFRYLPGKAYGKLTAIKADSGEIAWERQMRTPMGAGTMVTAGGVLFTGDAEGNFLAYEAAKGELLWSFQTGSGIRASPISYTLDGVQYIAIASGMAGAVGGYTGAGAPWMKNFRSGDTMYVFALFDANRSRQFHGGAVK